MKILSSFMKKGALVILLQFILFAFTVNQEFLLLCFVLLGHHGTDNDKINLVLRTR